MDDYLIIYFEIGDDKPQYTRFWAEDIPHAKEQWIDEQGEYLSTHLISEIFVKKGIE